MDVGHYRDKPGAISASGRAEFDFNLELAVQVANELRRRGLTVRMIGERGDYAELHWRTRDARGADLFLSVHHDSVQERFLAVAERFSGFSLFVSRRNPLAQDALRCASAMGAQLRAAGLKPSRYHADPVLGENRPFADEPNGVHWFDNLAVGHTATMPSVLLEAGVIVNPQEESRMRESAVQAAIAAAIAQGAAECLR